MTENEYLEAILLEQTLAPGSTELKELQERGEEVKKLLRGMSRNSVRVNEAGSKKKGTMIKVSYDLDITCYFPHEDDAIGESLKEIYENVEGVLKENYKTTRKGSAIRLWDPTGKTDFHVDVVPGRFVDGKEGDVFLYRSSGDKERLKTNLDVHVAHVRDSGVVDAIRLTKLWRERNSIPVKTFALELLVIKILEKKKESKLSEQMLYLWEQLRENSANLSIEDPANPTGNDLSELLTEGLRKQLSVAASRTTQTIEDTGWESVFGSAQTDKGKRAEALQRIAVATPNLDKAKPWANE